jgi:hypothetical protein
MGIRAILEMQDDEAETLRSALQEVPERLNSASLARAVEKAVPAVADAALEIVDALISLVVLLRDDGSDIELLAHDVSDSPDLDLDEELRPAFRDCLVGLMSLRPLQLAARAQDLVVAYERVFHGARMLTDVRPVFGKDVEDGPKAATIVSVLELEFHQKDQGVQSSYYALDQADLLALRSTIDRAVRKMAALRRVTEAAGLPIWEYQEPDDAASD